MVDLAAPAARPESAALKRKISPKDANPVPHKRSRVSRACDQCRASREKCDGVQPVCQTCTSQRRSCSYDEQPKKRGIQPNYIRTLELTLAWLFRHVPESETKLSHELPDVEGEPHRVISGKDLAKAESLHQEWRNGIICRQTDQMLSGLPLEQPQSEMIEGSPNRSSSPSAPPNDIQANGQISSDDTQWRMNDQDTRAMESSTLDQQRDLQLQQNVLQPDLSQRSVTLPPHVHASKGARLQLPDNAWTMLEYYFAFTHSWLPMTDKQAILKLMYTFPANGMLLEDAAAYAELWSIFALASSQMPPGQFEYRDWYVPVAKELIPGGMYGCSIGHVRALLLLGVLDMSCAAWNTAWLNVGSAVRRLLLLKSSTTPNNEPLRGDALAYVTLAAFVLEQFLTTHLRVPAHLTPRCLSVDQVIEDGLEEWSPWHDPLHIESAAARTPSRSLSTFNRIIRAALQAHDEAGDAEPHDGKDCTATVMALLHNARLEKARVQPSLLVAKLTEPVSSVIQGVSGSSEDIQLGFPWSNERSRPLQAVGEKIDIVSLAFMGIPNDSSEGASQRSPYLQDPSTVVSGLPRTPTAVQQVPNAQTVSLETLDLDNTLAGTDIFEEFAALEHIESSHSEQFKQNLGFAPDLDLAEFFGVDYQPSDPLLAYMQPSLFGPTESSDAG